MTGINKKTMMPYNKGSSRAALLLLAALSSLDVTGITGMPEPGGWEGWAAPTFLLVYDVTIGAFDPK